MRNKAVVLASRPHGAAELSNFRLVEQEVSALKPGEILVRNLWLSLDPYMRGRMDESKSYAASQALDETMVGGTAGEVVASNTPAFTVGDLVVCANGGWQLYFVSNEAGVVKVDPATAPLQAYLGPLGMPGVTAWYGVNKIIMPQPGRTIVVSAATGAVGSVAGQIVKAKGARAVGIAGGPEKCAFAVDTLGYDACVDHKAADFAAQLKAATATGIDGVFENVGGPSFQLCARRFNDFARVAICGLIASYEGAQPSSLDDLRVLLVKRAMMEGFIISDHLAVWPQAIHDLAGMAAAGALRWRETVANGLEQAPAAFLGLLKGENFGKQLVKLT